MTHWKSGSQEQNEALLCQLHERERVVHNLMTNAGETPSAIAAFLANIGTR